MQRKIWRFVVLLVLGLFMLGGCSQPGNKANNEGNAGRSSDAEAAESGGTLVIGAAASLNEAFTEIGEIFEAENPNWKVEFSFASSGNLKTSIEQGAPIDVFASAAKKQMDGLRDSGHIDPDTIKPLAKNELVMIVPQNSSVSSLEELMDLGKIALGEPESVPAGQYGKESLINIGYWDQLADKLVFTKDVRQALFYVEQDEVDAGFVYATDAAKSDSVNVVTAMPADSYTLVLYPIGILSETENRAGAEKWVEFVLGDKGQEVLERYGFKKP